MEDKQEICKKLYELLKATRAGEGLISIEYIKNDHEEFVKLFWTHGKPGNAEFYVQQICITGDSGRAIILDVLQRI